MEVIIAGNTEVEGTVEVVCKICGEVCYILDSYPKPLSSYNIVCMDCFLNTPLKFYGKVKLTPSMYKILERVFGMDEKEADHLLKTILKDDIGFAG